MSTRTAKVAPKKKRRRVPLPAAVRGLLNRDQVCEALGGISVRKLNGLISAGDFPRADKRVGVSPRWSVDLVNRWCEALGSTGPDEES